VKTAARQTSSGAATPGGGLEDSEKDCEHKGDFTFVALAFITSSAFSSMTIGANPTATLAKSSHEAFSLPPIDIGLTCTDFAIDRLFGTSSTLKRSVEVVLDSIPPTIEL
jgi:hypothetical protein